MSGHYNYISQNRPEMLAFMPPRFRTVLEVGCGDGSFAFQLKIDPETEVWGVEMDNRQAQLAMAKLDHVIAGDFMQIIDSQLLPLHNFDCIVFNDALEHFPETDSVLQIAKMLLKPGGYLVTSLPNFRFVGNLWEILIQKDFRYKESGILDRTHYRFFTQKSILRLMADHGFDVVKSHGINPTASLKVKILNMLTFNFFHDIRYLQIATQAQLKP